MRTEKEIIKEAKKILKKHYTLKTMDTMKSIVNCYWHATIDGTHLFSCVIIALNKANIRFYVTINSTKNKLTLGIYIKE